ncbi:methyltransferase type 11 [Mycobacterium avium subsp. hominissuis]|uniref:methyltransferase type 11 n=1 Tax=Mycobacterium avium TaxID=1764 RepID=UPI002664E944|nr:methyltransferase type 11 [Mycobacterium avium]MDO2396042.1 methyltransferase type 11 [Mycobacterium avium subsp. hominissuis]
MTTSTQGISDFVRKGIAAQNAADRAAGRLTAAEADHEVAVRELRARLGDELQAAIGAARQAARTLAELSGPVYDVEYAEGERGRDLAALIETARRELTAAQAQLVR